MRSHVMTARRKAALKKAQLASAAKRRRNGRIDRKISRVNNRAKKRMAKQTKKFQGGLYTHSTQGGLYVTKRAGKAYNKAVRINNRAVRKTQKLKGKKRR